MLLLPTNSFQPFLLFKRGMSEAAWTTFMAPPKFQYFPIPYFLLLDHFEILMGGQKGTKECSWKKSLKMCRKNSQRFIDYLIILSSM